MRAPSLHASPAVSSRSVRGGAVGTASPLIAAHAVIRQQSGSREAEHAPRSAMGLGFSVIRAQSQPSKPSQIDIQHNPYVQTSTGYPRHQTPVLRTYSSNRGDETAIGASSKVAQDSPAVIWHPPLQLNSIPGQSMHFGAAAGSSRDIQLPARARAGVFQSMPFGAAAELSRNAPSPARNRPGSHVAMPAVASPAAVEQSPDRRTHHRPKVIWMGQQPACMDDQLSRTHGSTADSESLGERADQPERSPRTPRLETCSRRRRDDGPGTRVPTKASDETELSQGLLRLQKRLEDAAAAVSGTGLVHL